MIVKLENISKSYGAHTVLENIEEKIEEGARIGMIGVNGAGKSTLLNIISGFEQPDAGQIVFGKDKSMGYMRQNTPLSSGKSIYEEMHSVFADLLAVEQEMNRLQSVLGDFSEKSDAYRQTAGRLQQLTRRFEAADGYQIDVKIATVLTGLGFEKSVWQQTVNHLSGGERVRLSLGKLLLTAPDLLLLDEPTNHLDFQTLSFLEGYIKNYRGAVLMVSHDRYFLDNTVDEIWEIEQPRLIRYPGNYTRYKQLRAERRAAMKKEYEKDQAKRAQLEDYIAKNLVRASTSAMAKSRRTQLEKMKPLEKPGAEYEGMHFAFHAAQKSGFDVLTVQNVSASVEGRQLFENVNLEIKRGDKIALVGKNGIGKTTLFRLLLQSAGSGESRIIRGKNVQIGYFDQHGESLDPSLTALEQIKVEFPGDADGAVRSQLAQVMLRGDAAFQPISALSGGQKAGVRFAMLKRRADNFLMLDEPTNHLDLMSRENLEQALMEYDGTILMITHDRYMLKRVPTVIYELDKTGLRRFDSFEEYVQTKKQPEKPAAKKVSSSNASSFYRDKKERARIVKIRRRITEIEQQSALLEQQTAQLESLLTGSDYQKLHQYCAQIDENKQLLSELAEEWMKLSEQLEGEAAR